MQPGKTRKHMCVTVTTRERKRLGYGPPELLSYFFLPGAGDTNSTSGSLARQLDNGTDLWLYLHYDVRFRFSIAKIS